ncbi:HD-GYP domain-containing protein [Marinisporobacter balticus]|uniref:HD domain-containing protein n=1 Tax=Marinisporobacter balticus TaxID=2018667 RepID=A0A4R2KFB3_9FIRM|nr:HD domain-containing protein [Marinisporobacter balticus]TCO69056.1 HD domain-containing protein [Marinisporobacter balticus]
MMYTNLSEIIYSLSRALDLSASGVANHHKIVALICLSIAKKLNMKEENRDLLFLSALVHDAGVISKEEAKDLLVFEDDKPFEHCRKGYEIFFGSKHTVEIAKILLFHHDHWKDVNESDIKKDEIALNSNIIYLADRVAIEVQKDKGYILSRNKEIIHKIAIERGTRFNPVVVDAFLEVSEQEAFWLDLQSKIIGELVNFYKPKIKVHITSTELVDIAFAFSKIIDSKSPYTYNHSNGVALVAEFLADKFGFSENEKIMIKVAGYLHDLGKIAVPNYILDKTSKLSKEEFEIVKKHPFYSYRLIQNIPGFEEIAAWGAFHHEKLDGSGYPFRLKGDEIPLGSRIMAVSDMFVALTEDRPYRKGLNKDICLGILKKESSMGYIDENVVNFVELFYDELVLLVKK